MSDCQELARLVLSWDAKLFPNRGDGEDEPVGDWAAILMLSRRVLRRGEDAE